jgi:signal transduction histidine kinase
VYVRARGRRRHVLLVLPVSKQDAEIRERRAERLAALGMMATGFAHGLRNPLGAAHLQLQVARRRLTQTTDGQLCGAGTAIALAQTELQRISALVEDFLQFARPQALQLRSVDLRSIAEVIVAMMSAEAAAIGVRLMVEQSADPVQIELDEERVKQALVNLLRNAIDASAPGHTVRVSTAVRRTSAWLTVQDSGVGVPADAPIFEPFFTTKEHGTGLGLAIVRRVALDHGGAVGVESTPGRTLFWLSLPMAAHG